MRKYSVSNEIDFYEICSYRMRGFAKQPKRPWRAAWAVCVGRLAAGLALARRLGRLRMIQWQRKVLEE